MNNKVFSDWGKEIIPNSQLEKSMAEVAVVNALIVRKGYLIHDLKNALTVKPWSEIKLASILLYGFN